MQLFCLASMSGQIRRQYNKAEQSISQPRLMGRYFGNGQSAQTVHDSEVCWSVSQPSYEGRYMYIGADF